MNELERIWKEAVVALSRYVSRHLLEGAEENLSQQSLCPGRNWNRGLSKYGSTALPVCLGAQRVYM
jgi:hypothetical protein